MTHLAGPPILEALTALDGALDDLANSPVWSLSDAETAAVVQIAERLRNRLDHRCLAFLRELDARGYPRAQGAASTKTWLRDVCRLDPGEAGRRVKLARALAEGCPATGQALAAGEINAEHATVITASIARVGRIVDPDTRDAAEQILLEHSKLASPDQVRRSARALEDAADPDGPEPKEKAARAHRTLNIRDLGEGFQRLTAILPDLEAAKLKAALDPLAAPRPAADGIRDERTPGQRRHDALIEIIDRHLTHGENPTRHGVRPHLVITAGLDLLLGLNGAEPARTATGETVSAELLARIACDAGITRVFTDQHGQPLDVGREKRCVTPAQWTALTIRDKGCTGPGCDRPAAMTEAHHMNEWVRDHGETNLRDLTLACTHCHDLAHHEGWTARMGEHGRVEWIPPPWRDPDQRPRINNYWHPPDIFGGR